MKFTGGGKNLFLNDETGRVEIKPPPKPRNTDRHKPGYMREYMRQWRAKRRAGKDAPASEGEG